MAKHFHNLSKLLQNLLYEHRMNISQLAKAIDMPTPTVHRIVTGKSTRPNQLSLQAIANFFSITVEQLIGEQELPPDLSIKHNIATTKKVMEIPLLNWDDLNKKTSSTGELIIVPSTLSKNCFALSMNDSSMEPVFTKNSILIFEPENIPHDRCYALIKLHSINQYVFRQIIIDLDNKFLRPLNPDLLQSQLRLLEESDEIVAVLVESRQNFKNTLSSTV